MAPEATLALTCLLGAADVEGAAEEVALAEAAWVDGLAEDVSAALVGAAELVTAGLVEATF